MDWVQVLSIIATEVAIGYYIHRKVQADIKSANIRTDRIYHMFIDLIKEGRK